MPVDPRIPISKAFEAPSDDEATEVEGHGITKKSEPMDYARGRVVNTPTDDDATADDAAEVEGHTIRGRVMDGPADADDVTAGNTEVEGHITRKSYLPEKQATDEFAPEQAEGDDVEAEGHAQIKRFMPDASEGDATQAAGDEAEVAGHGRKPPTPPEDDTEVEGHLIRVKVVEPPSNDEDAPAGDADDAHGDAESIVRKG